MPCKLITDLDPAAQLPLDERALHYGDGLFETMLLSQGGIRFWDEHYQRLHTGAQSLAINCPDKDWLQHHLQPYINLGQQLIVKILLTRGSGGRGLQLPESCLSNLYLLHYPFDTSLINQTVKAFYSSILLPLNSQLAGIKHLNRLNYVLATDDLNKHPEYDDALLINESGQVIESIVHNLFFVRRTEVYTPDLDQSGVRGIMRQHIIKLLKRRGKTVKIGNYSRQDIESADECFLCNSVQGIRPLIKVGQRDYPIGPVTRLLQQDIHVS